MSWKNVSITWEKTEHPWDKFGIPVESLQSDQDLDAKLLAIWRRQELGEIVEQIVEAASSAVEYTEDPQLATGFALAVASINLFPLHLKLIQEDEQAIEFLKLLCDENGSQYFLKAELDSKNELEWLINYFLEQEVLAERGDRFLVNGRVLNRAHVLTD